MPYQRGHGRAYAWLRSLGQGASRLRQTGCWGHSVVMARRCALAAQVATARHTALSKPDTIAPPAPRPAGGRSAALSGAARAAVRLA
eukprot:scaffold5725_cov387-Prasinococcus_capsulatus_cf.AAC.9